MLGRGRSERGHGEGKCCSSDRMRQIWCLWCYQRDLQCPALLRDCFVLFGKAERYLTLEVGWNLRSSCLLLLPSWGSNGRHARPSPVQGSLAFQGAVRWGSGTSVVLLVELCPPLAVGTQPNPVGCCGISGPRVGRGQELYLCWCLRNILSHPTGCCSRLLTQIIVFLGLIALGTSCHGDWLGTGSRDPLAVGLKQWGGSSGLENPATSPAAC